MSRLKTFAKYAIWVILFFIFSELIINVGLNSSYKDMKRRDNISQVTVFQAQSTKVNGRIKGIINSQEISNKYIEIDLYSKRNVFLGKEYIEVNKEKENQVLELYFKTDDVSEYEIVLTDEKQTGGELHIIPEDMKKPEIILATIVAFLIFW